VDPFDRDGKADARPLFDCGEGTQVPIKAASLGVGHIDTLAVTHLHADHVTGIPGMLMLIGQADDERPRDLLALPTVCDYVGQTRKLLGFHMPFELRYHPLDPAGGTFQGDGFTLEWAPLEHRVPNLGFRYEEATRPGRFDAARADALGVPRGPARRALQNGEDVEVGGRRFEVKYWSQVIASTGSGQRPTPRRKAPKLGRQGPSDGEEGLVVAPMQGTIVKVHHAAGESVRANEPVCVLEAMKMENEITAPVDGDIVDLRVQPGDTVTAGAIIMIIK